MDKENNIDDLLKLLKDSYGEDADPSREETITSSSGDADMYTGARFSYEGDFLEYLGLEDIGIFTNHDADCLEKIRQMAAAL